MSLSRANASACPQPVVERADPSALGPGGAQTSALESVRSTCQGMNPPNGPALLAIRYSLPATSSAPALPVRRRLGEGGSLSKGFTIVEVMMASVILVVGLMGMIQGVTIGSEMMATARRQTLASQILEHEIGKLRLTDWNSLPAAGTTAVTIDSHFTNAIASCGLAASAINLSRTTTNIDTDSDGTTDLREVTFTVTWTKSGTTTAATPATGSWFDQLSFAGSAPIARTYTRKSTAYFGQYGLNLKL